MQPSINQNWISRGVLFIFYAIISLLLALTFLYPFSFNFELDINQHYTYLLGGLFLFILANAFSLAKDRYQVVNFNFPFLISFLFLNIYVLGIVTDSPFYGASNEKLANIAVPCSIYVSIVLLKSILKAESLLYVLVFFWIVQLMMGLYQYIFAVYTESNGQILMLGGLANSGIYATFMVAFYPIVSYAVEKRISKRIYLRNLLNGLTVIILLFILYNSMARTAMLIAIFYLLYYAVKKYGKLLSIKTGLRASVKLTAALAISLTLVYAGYKLFLIKKMSAVGRLMRIDISLDHSLDNLWFGTGIGRFTWHYPQWQATYFETSPSPPPDYYLSAGESYIVFNEYLQLFLETGVVGSVLLITLLISFFRSSSESNKDLVSTIKLVTCGILLTGLFSYPFHVNIILQYLGVLFGIVFLAKNAKASPFALVHIKRIQKTFLFASILLVAISFYVVLMKSLSVDRWTSFREDTSIAWERKQSMYENALRQLKNDGKFLSDYGLFLSTDSSYMARTSEILERSNQLFLSRESTERLIDAHLKCKDYSKAIERSVFLSNYLPNKFEPKFQLLKLYCEVNDSNSIQRIGQVILNMPIKIPSKEVVDIKASTRLILNERVKHNVFPN